MIFYCYVVHCQTISCQAPLVLSSQPTGDKLYPLDNSSCVRYRHCSNDLAAEVPINAINCSIPESTSGSHCHLWGSDGPHQQMLFVYLLRITSNTMTMHYLNDSSSSQQKPSITRQQLCTANNNLDIARMISKSYMSQNQDSVCCTNFYISISFNGGRMRVHFLHSIIEILVDHLNCTSKS